MSRYGNCRDGIGCTGKYSGNHGLQRDGLNLNLGIGLSVTHLALRILLGAIGEDGDLLRLAVLDYLSCNLGSLNGGCTKLEVTIVARQRLLCRTQQWNLLQRSASR